MDLIKSINTFINPFGTIAILLFAVLLILFFANSKKNSLKIFSFIFTLLAFISSFTVNIIGFLRNGAFSDNLFTSAQAQIIEISYILIISFILFIIIFVFNRNSESFLKLNIIFIFSSSALIFFTISRNFIVFFASLIFFLISLFASITLISETDIFIFKNKSNMKKAEINQEHHWSYMSISKFFLAVLFSVLFIFFGTSLLYGVSDFKNFIQLYEGVSAFKDNLGFVFAIFGIAIYLYFGFFPFHSPYIKMTSRISSDSNYLIWLYYFLPGAIFMTRLSSIIYNVNDDFKTVLIITMSAIVIISAIGSSLTILKTNNLRKITSNIVLLIFTGNIFNLLLYIIDYINEDTYRMINYSGLSLLILSFLPVSMIFTLIEKNTGCNDIRSLKSIFIKNKAALAGYIIGCISLLGVPAFAGFTHKNHYIGIIQKAFQGGLDNLGPIMSWLVISVAILYVVLFAASILRLLISSLTGRMDTSDGGAVFSRLSLAFIYCFVLLIIIFGISYLLGLFGININGLDFSIIKSF
ncbi:MAG: hypothetical protein PHU65_05290 [Actinomycetota bacterium]|nr:hypothetical protein [Actinomycetota bacterium]